MNTHLGIGSASSHVKRAADRFKEWAVLKSYVQKQKAQKTGIQLGVSAVFGLFLLVWAEVSLYLAFAASMKPYFAALLVFAFNLLIVGGVNLAIMSWKRGLRHSEDRVLLHQMHEGDHKEAVTERLSAPDAVLRAARNRHEAQLELMSARTELFDSANSFVHDNIKVPVNRYIVTPFNRYRAPIAFTGSFVVGLLIARALLPKREPVSLELIEVTEMPSATVVCSDDLRSVI